MWWAGRANGQGEAFCTGAGLTHPLLALQTVQPGWCCINGCCAPAVLHVLRSSLAGLVALTVPGCHAESPKDYPAVVVAVAAGLDLNVSRKIETYIRKWVEPDCYPISGQYYQELSSLCMARCGNVL